jgi:predicted nucleic acid-binding protein
MAWLIDTNIVSDARKPRPDPRIVSFFSTHRTSELYISVVTFAEIRFGIELVDDHARRAVLAQRRHPAQVAVVDGAGAKERVYVLAD